jgi:hypothetical protein
LKRALLTRADLEGARLPHFDARVEGVIRALIVTEEHDIINERAQAVDEVFLALIPDTRPLTLDDGRHLDLAVVPRLETVGVAADP